MRELLQERKAHYDDLKDEVNLLKADGNLAKLCNLRTEFDESFDAFFEDKDLRKKYNAWDVEEDSIDFDVTGAELEEMLDNEDITKLIEVYNEIINSLEEEKQEITRNREVE